MLNRLLLLVVMVVLTLFAFSLVKGDGPGSGDLFWAPTAEYGVNTGDLPIVGVWLVAVGCCVVLLLRTPRG